MDPASFGRFNYLPAAPEEGRALPIGFARDVRDDSKLPVTRLRWYKGQGKKEPWVGLNCAACHTTSITHGDATVRIDGAPTLADFQGFTGALLAAMDATLCDPAKPSCDRQKWDRFASRVVAARRKGDRDEARVASDKAALRSAFSSLLGQRKALAAYDATNVVYGYGRLDAVGHILNKVAFLNADPLPIRGEPNAPVSYPFIWNAAQHDYVQWNGLVPNKNIRVGLGEFHAGALVRNTSEVIGVFADVKTRRLAGLNGYKSSIDVSNLDSMEIQLARLYSPAWPAAFGRLDPQEVRKGGELFREVGCSDCHKPLNRTDTATPVVAQMIPIWGPRGVGTDPWMVCNTFTYQARGGLLTGTRENIFGGTPLPEMAPTRSYLQTQAIGVLLNEKDKVLAAAARAVLGIERPIETLETAIEQQPPRDQPRDAERRLADCMAAAAAAAPGSEDRRVLAYKARPLNGIWATAPYLHNGSVMSLYELLLPPARRTTEFWVGNREFDVVNVGFVNKPSAVGSWFRTSQGGKPVFGNSNAGHDYGNAQLTDTQRMLLIAYMKSL